jgi:hypothetical protein
MSFGTGPLGHDLHVLRGRVEPVLGTEQADQARADRSGDQVGRVRERGVDRRGVAQQRDRAPAQLRAVTADQALETGAHHRGRGVDRHRRGLRPRGDPAKFLAVAPTHATLVHMRDPLAPIPSPARDPGFWQSTTTPRATRLPAHLRPEPDVDGEEYSPMRLLERNQGDTHGLDRRGRRRAAPAPVGEDHGTDRLLSAAHRPVDAVLGLSTSHGWALVRTLSFAPAGILLHLLDLVGPDLRPDHRARGQAVLRRLAPLLGAPLRPGAVHGPGSPLATVGGCLLAPRVVADLSCFASQPVGRRGTSQRRPAALTVTLLLPTDTHAQVGASPLHGITCVEGELVPMTDPQPKVLAVALSPRALAQLELAAPRRRA